MVKVMINDSSCKSLYLPRKTASHLYQEVKNFPSFLMNDQLLMHGDVDEVDPRNYESKNVLDVFLFDEFIVFTICDEYKDIHSKILESVHKLSELQFFMHEKNILSMETTSGQSLTPEGARIRLFRIPESKASEWIKQLKSCDVRIEMKEKLQHRSEDLPGVVEDEEVNFNKSKRRVPLGDYKNKPIGDCRPRSYSHDPKSPSVNVSDLSFTMAAMSNNDTTLDQPWNKTETSLEQQTNTSDDSTTTDSYGSERQSKRSMPRSLSVDNTPRVSVTNANKPHSLPSNLKSVKVKKHSNNKVYQYIVKTIGLTKSTAEQGGLCRHIGNRYAHGSPELNCRASSEIHYRHSSETESMLSILTLKPVQIAQELTRYQAEMLQAISPLELQKGAWTSKKKYTTAPNVIRMIEFHNHLIKCMFGKWILQEHNVEKRAKVIKRLITIAEECRQLNNFETVHTIIQCLTLNAISRLSKTWELLNGTSKKLFTSLSNLVHSRMRWKNYKIALEVAKRKGYFIPILPVFLNYLEHSNLFYHEQNVEKLVYIQEDNYSWTELSRSGEQRGAGGTEKTGSISKGSFKWLRSKSLSTSPSPLRSHIEEKLRENVQSIVEQTNSGKEEGSRENSNLTLEETPLYLLRLYQLNSAQYCLPPSPIVAKFLQLPFTQCSNASEERWQEVWNQMCVMSEKLEPPVPK
ncbi:uncharacterized protein LOC134826097 isoform X2 [Bolinopsis microptera]|uniref:uncharacterized protein LOC134826097 isoform X2 n=2 Tax=Bolinopsis microptera TaxID=2820187 RepID=UPI00307A4AA5